VPTRPTPTDLEGFAIYLPAREMTSQDILAVDLSTLDLGKVVLSSTDIVTYSKDTHEFALTPAAYERLRQIKVPVSGIPFIVCVDRQPIYGGAFWAAYSSLSFEGLVIDVLAATNDRPLRIQPGYPAPSWFAGQDHRADPRILAALQQVGKLR
jgi:hypothetical protein